MIQEKKYFVFAHTAKGFINLLQKNIDGIKNIFICRHHNLIVLTEVFSQLMDCYRGNEMEIIVNIDNTSCIDGIIIRNLSIAILSDHLIHHPIPGAKTINLSNINVEENKNNMLAKQQIYESAYLHFAKGLSIHDKLEKIYIKAMNFEKANSIISKLIKEIFTGSLKEEKDVHIPERFFATNTPDGIINFMEKITEQSQQRIFIKGRAGTGKSYLMNRILDECIKRNIHVELYRCSLDPQSIDMLVIGDNEFCLFDSTPPHELFPDRQEDMLIDLYKDTVKEGTDEKFELEIASLNKLYKQEMRIGLDKLKEIQIITNNYLYNRDESIDIEKYTRLICEQIVK